jgi:hypothetical protein
MPLSKERIGEIAMLVLQNKLEQDNGVRLNPKEVKREIMNSSKKFGITPQEGAEFVGIIIESAYRKTMAEIDAMKTDKTDKVEEEKLPS